MDSERRETKQMEMKVTSNKRKATEMTKSPVNTVGGKR